MNHLLLKGLENLHKEYEETKALWLSSRELLAKRIAAFKRCPSIRRRFIEDSPYVMEWELDDTPPPSLDTGGELHLVMYLRLNGRLLVKSGTHLGRGNPRTPESIAADLWSRALNAIARRFYFHGPEGCEYLFPEEIAIFKARDRDVARTQEIGTAVLGFIQEELIKKDLHLVYADNTPLPLRLSTNLELIGLLPPSPNNVDFAPVFKVAGICMSYGKYSGFIQHPVPLRMSTVIPVEKVLEDGEGWEATRLTWPPEKLKGLILQAVSEVYNTSLACSPGSVFEVINPQGMREIGTSPQDIIKAEVTKRWEACQRGIKSFLEGKTYKADILNDLSLVFSRSVRAGQEYQTVTWKNETYSTHPNVLGIPVCKEGSLNNLEVQRQYRDPLPLDSIEDFFTEYVLPDVLKEVPIAHLEEWASQQPTNETLLL